MISSINPYTQNLIKEYDCYTESEISIILKNVSKEYCIWKKTTFEERSTILLSISEELKRDIEIHAEMISIEMGKPIVESRMEIDKCIWVLNYFATNSSKFLNNKSIKTEYTESYVEYSPIGVVLGIMPWNFPYWQVIRFIAPALMAGNTCIVKHAPNVTGCSLLIEKLFINNSKYKNIYRTLIIEEDRVKLIIENDIIKAVSLTGSEQAGSAVAMLAGKEIKKTVLELGGSDPFIVLNDSDINIASKTAINARFFNSGQSCIAAKRFLIQSAIYDEFINNILSRIKKMIVGNPLNDKTQIGPLAKIEFVHKIDKFVNSSIDKGAKCLIGGNHKGCFYYPTMLIDVDKDMDVFKEETFAPVFCVTKFEEIEDAIKLANKTKYGLGGSIWSSNINLAKKIGKEINSGSIFINDMTKSDPRLPFGGVNKSGYGKELSEFGILEFVNIKTIVIK